MRGRRAGCFCVTDFRPAFPGSDGLGFRHISCRRHILFLWWLALPAMAPRLARSGHPATDGTAASLFARDTSFELAAADAVAILRRLT